MSNDTTLASEPIEDVFSTIPVDDGIMILDKNADWYYVDNTVVQEVRRLIVEGKKFLGSSRMKWGAKRLPFLLVNKGASRILEEGTYMIPGNPIPQIVIPTRVGDYTVYRVDFF